MKSVLVIGLGLFGRQTAKKLSELNHDVMAIDKDEAKVDMVLPYITNAQIGDCTNEAFLRSIGVEDFDLCIVTIGENFQSSLETTSILKELGAKAVISRASTDIHAKFLLKNGADHIIYPKKQLANWAAIRFTSDHIIDFMEINEDCGIFEINVPDSWDGKTVAKLDIRRRFNINIMAVKSKDKFDVKIAPDTMLHLGQTLLVLGSNDDVNKCFKV